MKDDLIAATLPCDGERLFSPHQLLCRILCRGMSAGYQPVVFGALLALGRFHFAGKGYTTQATAP
jgi:hypothetical protein